MRQFFLSLPVDLEDAARIDGPGSGRSSPRLLLQQHRRCRLCRRGSTRCHSQRPKGSQSADRRHRRACSPRHQKIAFGSHTPAQTPRRGRANSLAPEPSQVCTWRTDRERVSGQRQDVDWRGYRRRCAQLPLFCQKPGPWPVRQTRTLLSTNRIVSLPFCGGRYG